MSDSPRPEQAQSFPGAFCESCNKWRKPDMLMPDGSCPKCRSVLDAHEPGEEQNLTEEEAAAAARAAKIPWHFWVMVAATVLYLGWRVIQGLQSLF